MVDCAVCCHPSSQYVLETHIVLLLCIVVIIIQQFDHVNALQSTATMYKIYLIFTIFYLNTLQWITLVEFKNQLISISKMALFYKST